MIDLPRQRGAVVIVALLVVALAATVASYALQRQDSWLRQLQASRDAEQARWVLRGGTHWARTILVEDARASGAVDHPGELWASGLPATRVEDGTLSGSIADEQALFNLANLVRDGKPSPRDISALSRLLGFAGLDARLASQISAAPALREWSDVQKACRCEEKVVARIRAFATVLPQRTPVNVNTASPEVLAAVVEGMEIAEAMVLVQEARSNPFRNVADFSARLPRKALVQGIGEVSVESRYFRVLGRAVLGKADIRLDALLQRQGSAWPSIVWQRTS